MSEGDDLSKFLEGPLRDRLGEAVSRATRALFSDGIERGTAPSALGAALMAFAEGVRGLRALGAPALVHLDGAAETDIWDLVAGETLVLWLTPEVAGGAAIDWVVDGERRSLWSGTLAAEEPTEIRLVVDPSWAPGGHLLVEQGADQVVLPFVLSEREEEDGREEE